ncbi:MAG TPA: polysaccharide lyase family 7 protein [Actinocrinis sp.]|nr:polysaccharide lyase family 7 protein [Actinocrinis sp.]
MKELTDPRTLIKSAARRRARTRAAVAAATALTAAGALTLAAAVGSALAAAAPAAASAVSLSGWKLTLPVDSSGCPCGSATEVDPAAVRAPWLVRNANGSLTFWAPTKGAHTPNSLHPRTELVDLSDFTAGSGTHTLKGTFSIQKLPSANDIIIGQIHGGGSSSAIPLVMLHYRSGAIVAVTRKSPAVGGSTTATVLTGVPLNAAFSCTIEQNGSKFLISAAYGAKSGQATVAVPSSFKGMDVRFQAGDYQQTDANQSSTDGGRLTIIALSAS